jgi:hypothetical protein
MDFNQYCRDQSIWLIKYTSDNIAPPIYLLWYHDLREAGKSKLLTYNNGKIFAAQSLHILVNNDISKIESLNINPRIIQFVKLLKDFSNFTITSFDMTSVIANVSQNLLTPDTLSWTTDFLYLVDDYLYSNPNDIPLKELMADHALQNVVTYYNESILWPSLSDADTFSAKKPALDHIILEEKLKKVITLFDNAINSDANIK